MAPFNPAAFDPSRAGRQFVPSQVPNTSILLPAPVIQYWMSYDNYIYFGNMQPGDRAATTDEIIEYNENLPPDLSKGIAIISTGTPTINGTYAVNSPAVIAEILYIQVSIAAGTPKFSNEATTKQWPEVNGTLHTFTVPNFYSLSQACAQYVDAVVSQTLILRHGGTPDWPLQPVTIP